MNPYSPPSPYRVGEVVTYQGTIYEAVNPVPPNVPPTDGTYWAVVALDPTGVLPSTEGVTAGWSLQVQDDGSTAWAAGGGGGGGVTAVTASPPLVSSGGDTPDITAPGVPVVRAFLFAFDTPNILTGASLYTPTIGDILLDAWIEVDTAWDGTTPLGDIGTFDGVNGGMFSNTLGAVNMIHADSAGEGFSLDPHQLAQGSSNTGTDILQGSIGASITSVPATNVDRSIPAKFTAANPIKVCVSQDGTNTGADPGSTQGAAILYLVTATPA